MEMIKTKKGISYRETVWVSNGQRESKTFIRKTDAKIWKQKRESEKRNRVLGFKKFKSIFLLDLAREWIAAKIEEQKKPRTVEIYKCSVNSNINLFFGKLQADQIKLATLDEYVRFLKNKGLSPATINKEMSVLRLIFKFAVEHEYLPENPMKKSFHQKVTNKKLDYFTDIEVRALLDHNKDSAIYPILFIAIHTGMRLSEILGLCWDRVDFVSNRIEITRILVRGKLHETTKSGKIRYFPMNSKLKEMFLQLRRNQKDSAFVFLDENNEVYNSDHFRQRHFAKVCLQARVRQLRFHDLRHTFASHFMMKGGDIFGLSKLLGHSDVSMTQIYAHLSPQHLESASEIVDFGIGFQKDISFSSHENFDSQKIRLISDR